MKTIKQNAGYKIGLTLCAALAVATTGCIGHFDDDRGRTVYVAPPSAYVETTVVVQPEYVYYPAYEVYYSSNTRQYVYRDGRSWVSRPEPPRVSASVLLATPSVKLDFHDSPAMHHTAVTRQYPKHWASPAQNHGREVSQHSERN